ncbi:MAG: hypothetical protein JW754_00715 [Candidatus Aenigmarchaeota archaeon]|nr:hypothetical protein [Candidatus Aenigmarchaeota archaeon]
MKIQKIILPMVISMVMILMITSAEAVISMGSVTGKNHALAEPGETVEFKILLFNIHEDSGMIVNLNVDDYPEGWTVWTEPEDMELPYTLPSKHVEQEPGYEYLSVPNTGEMIKVKPVVLKAEVPDDAGPGEYRINVVASAGKYGGTLSMTQSRDFSFTVEIQGNGEYHQNNDHFAESGINKSDEHKIINTAEETREEMNKTEEKTGTVEQKKETVLSPTGIVISGSSMVAVFVWVVVIIIIIKMRRSG